MHRIVLLALVVAGLVPASAQAWTWPVGGRILRPFVFGSDPYAGGQHRGMDVAGDLGTDVLAPASGTVSFAGTVPKGGKTLSIRTPDGYTVSLQHLGSIRVRKGDPVTRLTAFDERKSHKVTALVTPGEKCTIAVRVLDWYGAGGIHRPVALGTAELSPGGDILR